MTNFFPKGINPGIDLTEDYRVLIAGQKSQVKTDLLATEVCMSRCKLDLSKPRISQGESDCLR